MASQDFIAVCEKLGQDPNFLGQWIKYPDDALKPFKLSEGENNLLKMTAGVCHDSTFAIMRRILGPELGTDAAKINFSCTFNTNCKLG